MSCHGSNNHPVKFVNEIHKMLDNFVISNPFCQIYNVLNYIIIKRAVVTGRRTVVLYKVFDGRFLPHQNISTPTEDTADLNVKHSTQLNMTKY